MPPAQHAAWDAYHALTAGLLPAVRSDPTEPAVNALLGGVAKRILRDAPLWDAHGPMLVCAVKSAVRLYRAGEQDDLLDLLWSIADRLYVLSALPGTTTT